MFTATLSPAEHTAALTRVSSSRKDAICAFAGGALPHTILSCCRGTLLSMFTTPAVLPLRAACKEAVTVVAAFPWEDRGTVILGRIARWRACFPRARCANVRMWDPDGLAVRRTPVLDADFVHFAGLWELNMRFCKNVTDAAFVHLRGIQVLEMSYCNQGTITNAALAHLAGIQRLGMRSCNQATLTDAACSPAGHSRSQHLPLRAAH
jgi:hypothetical protein